MITPQNIFRHELIGLRTEIIESNHTDYIGIKGKVIDETYNTLTIDTGDKEKLIPKKDVVFMFYLSDNKKVSVEGNVIISRPEDRIKKKYKKIW
ncbi:MAG: ribonuclease P protein component 1 [Methanobacteriaceae archaeon]|nr:ribonuclease P protein component 1 [Methanobacteriaceae archaeon]